MPLANIRNDGKVCLGMTHMGNIFECVDFFWNSRNNNDSTGAIRNFIGKQFRKNKNDFWGIKNSPYNEDCVSYFKYLKIFFENWQNHFEDEDSELLKFSLFGTNYYIIENAVEIPEIMKFYELSLKDKNQVMQELDAYNPSCIFSHLKEKFSKLWKDKYEKENNKF